MSYSVYVFGLKCLAILVSVNGYLTGALIPLTADDGERLLVPFLAWGAPSLQKCPFNSFARFQLGYWSFYY